MAVARAMGRLELVQELGCTGDPTIPCESLLSNPQSVFSFFLPLAITISFLPPSTTVDTKKCYPLSS